MIVYGFWVGLWEKYLKEKKFNGLEILMRLKNRYSGFIWISKLGEYEVVVKE